MNAGYLIPQNINPETDFCAKVYIPNDETYKQNFLGAYLYFCSWVAWERNVEKTGKDAAKRWNDAAEKTLMSWRDGCGCEDADDMTQEEITQLIQEIMEAMTINITNTNCCGCCGDTVNPGSPVDYTIPLPEEPPTSEPPTNEPPLNPDNAQKCSMANYLVYTLRLTLLKVAENGGSFLTFTAWAAALFTSPVDFVYGLAYQTWQWAKQSLTGTDIDVSDVIDEFYNYYVCNLFSSTDTVSAHSALMGSLYQTLKGYPDLSYAARLIANELPYELLFMETGEIDIPVGFENRECCGEEQGSVPALPILPEDSAYEFIPILTEEVTEFPNNFGADVVYNEQDREFKHVALVSGLNYHEIDVKILVNELVTRIGALSCHGYVFIITKSSMTGTVALRLSNSSGGTVQHTAVVGKQIVYHQNDEYANVPEFKDLCDMFPTKQNYGNGVLTNVYRNGFRTESYTNDLTPTFSVRVWAICKVS